MPTAWEDAINAESPAPFLWVKFDEVTTGSTPSSLTENGSKSFNDLDGTRGGGSSGAPGVESGKSGKALQFLGDATNYRTYYRFASTSTYNLEFDDGKWSVEWWAKTPYLFGGKNPTAWSVLGTNKGINATYAGAGQTNAGKLFVQCVGSDSTVTVVSSSTTPTDDQWHHYVVVYDSSLGSANLKLYIDGVLDASTNGTFGEMESPEFRIGINRTALNSYAYQGILDEVIVWEQALTATDVEDHYEAVVPPATNISYAAAVMATATPHATFPDATVSAENNNTYTADAMTASADTVTPTSSSGATLDAFGVATASSLFVDPAITTTSQIDIEYSHTVSTASALFTDATASTTKTVNYSASPVTASALFAANSYFGPTAQDTSYTLSIRKIGETTNTDGKQGFVIGSQYTNSTLDSRSSVAIKPLSGVPSDGALIKAKFDPAHVSASYNAVKDSNQFNVYVFTANPSTTFDTMNYTNLPAKELLYTTRSNDADGQYLDLTRAFVDSRAASYGIFIEHVGEPPYSSTQFDRTEYSGADLDNKLLYLLTSDFVSVNYNAAVMSVSNSEMTAVTITTTKQVDYSASPATVSAEFVNPTIVTEQTITVSADVSTASALSVEPTLDFSAIAEPEPFIAFATSPNATASTTANVNIQVDPTTVDALLHMPQAQIGEEALVDHMDASALFVEPLVIIPISVEAMVTTATADIVDPTNVTELLGVYFAQPMKATALAPNPPAYIDLQSDPWFAKLYAQHSVRHGLPAGYGYSFLKLFEDQNTDIIQSTPNTAQAADVFNGEPTLRQLRNNLTWGMYVNSGPENDNRKPVAPAITDYSTSQNESRMSVGYFDDWNRKAIRLQNIGFKIKNDFEYARHMFSLEFSIKTTKADQIISYGEFASQTGTGRGKTTFNLVDGKLNFLTYAAYELYHSKSAKPGNWSQIYRDEITGNTQINDGQWHHIVIQYNPSVEADEGIGERFQIWIDGNLDIQRFGRFIYDPDYMGANVENSTYAPDFYTSAWSVDTQAFVSERDIDLHYFDFIKYNPVLAEPMTATTTATQSNFAKGNRARALMLYWWPQGNQNQNLITRGFNTPYQSAGFSEFDRETFDNILETWDFVNRPPQEYFGWDIFPVDITGYFVSDLVKESAYGGSQNIVETWEGPFSPSKPRWKINRRGYFRNTLDDTRRYLDVLNDIDLSQFDAIFFKNYPDQTNELDFYARDEVVDSYFNIRETKIYEDFVKSIEGALQTGISLYVTNPQLALDLGIIDRIEIIPQLQDGFRDTYAPTIAPTNALALPNGPLGTARGWEDSHYLNKNRIVNTVQGLTDIPGIIKTDEIHWNNDDSLDFGGVDRDFYKFVRKDTLQANDEFIMSNYSQFGNHIAVPFNNVKAGTILTALQQNYYRGTELVSNPYANYATSIVVRPGDVLNGQQVASRIYVNFSERLENADEFGFVELTTNYWIDWAFSQGGITAAQRDTYKNDIQMNLDLKLAQGVISQAQYDRDSYWSVDGMNVISQVAKFETTFQIDQLQAAQAGGATALSKNNISDAATTGVLFTGRQIWFTFKYSRRFPILEIKVPSINTRGFWWLSKRVVEVGLVQRPLAKTASAIMVQPTVIAVKPADVNAQAMTANAIHVSAVGFAGADSNNLSLPMTATALINQPTQLILAAVMTASANFRENIITRTSASDQVIVYVLHEDPILYLREDIIK